MAPPDPNCHTGPLRPMKGLMIALQHYHKAEESRFGGGAQ
jgi:uncharacterized protein (DUF983 family)